MKSWKKATTLKKEHWVCLFWAKLTVFFSRVKFVLSQHIYAITPEDSDSNCSRTMYFEFFSRRFSCFFSVGEKVVSESYKTHPLGVSKLFSELFINTSWAYFEIATRCTGGSNAWSIILMSIFCQFEFLRELIQMIDSFPVSSSAKMFWYYFCNQTSRSFKITTKYKLWGINYRKLFFEFAKSQ